LTEERLVKNLLPQFIQTQYLDGKTNGRFKAYAMFIDLSGFTPLTETLMLQGNRGAEELSVILNEIFEPLVSLVYAKGGFIPYFAGDAFTAIFPQDDTGYVRKDFLEAAQLVRNNFRERESRFGDFTIGLKIGLSYGEVEWGIVGKSFKSYYFRGAPIDSCGECQLKARDQEILMDESMKAQLPEGRPYSLEEVGVGFYRLLGDIPVSNAPLPPSPAPDLIRDVALHFLPPSVADYNQVGEFRTVIAVFISFTGVDNHRLLDQFAGVVLEQINNFSGYFKEIDFGDKGGVLVGFFGAPVSFENNIDRALEFISAVCDELNALEFPTSMKFRVGITVGTAYTGIVGGKERCQYAAVGNRVNLAARLMTYADWGEILVDSEIQKNRRFKFQHRGDIKYKGIKGNVPTFRLIGPDAGNNPAYTGQMIDRDEEMTRLFRFVEPLFERQLAGVSYVFGEPGVGKSRLAYELRQALVGQNLVHWHVCQADQILKKPFNPFIYFLKNYFEQSPDRTAQANRDNFEERYGRLLDQLTGIDTPGALQIAKELIRTKAVLAALVGIFYSDSIWDQLDAKGRYQNTLAAITNLILAESLLQPVVIALEDAHWLDDNSGDLLTEFIRHIKGHPILLLITSRYRDDGAKPPILDRGLIESFDIPQLEIDLNHLAPGAVRTFAENTLNGKIAEEFYELLLRTTNSNPFYLEQMLEYFSESNLLKYANEEWTIKDKNVKLSSSVNAILTARIDRLSTLVKETVKAAAVIGREFEVPVLSEVMRAQDLLFNGNSDTSALLKEQIKTAERGQIWQAMNELRYIFRHSLLREAVYSMQLRTRLQQLHQLIAEAIERIYPDTLEERYFDLAFHYEQAGVFDKTCEYLRKSADHARSNFQNQQALDYYDRLLKKLGRQKDVVDQIQTHLKKGKILELIGQWDECQETFEKALQLAKKSRDVLLLGRANNSLGRLLMLKGDYTKAMTYLQIAAGLFESIDDKPGIANVYGNLGNLNFRRGDYEEAKSFFERSIQISKEEGIISGNAQIVANLGLTHMNQGDFEEGIRVQEEYLEFCRRSNDKQGMASLYTNIGIVYFEKGDYDHALENYEKGLLLSEELGNKLLYSIAIGCIGSVYERKGDYEKAMEHFQRDLEICEELGDKQGIAIALGLIGELLSIMGEFHHAIEYLQKNLMLCEELGYQKGIAKAVNTLGDVFFYTKQYDRSLHFYNRAIEVTRNIRNKLVLGISLVEKGAVLVETGNLEHLDEVFHEALEVAEELGNPDLLFEAKLLAARTHRAKGETKQALSILYGLLISPLSNSHEASVYFELFQTKPENDSFREKALELYKKLYEQTPRYSFKDRIETLAEGGGGSSSGR
jgi:tetratricopeptide (TPR) repeat protein/class 3 adenylate cyclase